MDFFKIDNWFLVLMFVCLGSFFLWAVKYIFDGLKESIANLDESVKVTAVEMKKLIEELFIHRNDHEKRLVAIETKCSIQHGEEYYPPRQSGGRRHYDPPTPPQGANV